MRLPARDYSLALGVRCPVHDVPGAVWQAHLVKHALGIRAMARTAGGHWSEEGWDRLEPPVVTADERASLVATIGGLRKGPLRCKVPEFTGGAGSHPERMACEQCPPALVHDCERVLHGAPGPGERYAAVTEALLATLEHSASVAVTRVQVTRALTAVWNRPDALDGLAVLSFGVDDRTTRAMVARITRSDGVRAEFYREGSVLRWRTTYRKVPNAGPSRLSFILDMARPGFASSPLSDACVVPRPWWERHGR